MPKAPSPKEIRDLYTDYMNEWREIREEAKTDMRFVAGDPWDPKDRKARQDAGRPCISLDECNQFLNQAINNIRQNKRSIEVTPKGFGANDDDAEHRENVIRGIERRSDGQGACITAYENALQRSYGFAMLTTDYVEGMSFDQEIKFRRIANPDSILIDPNYKTANACDIKRAFVLDLMRKEDFKRKYPRKKVEGFALDEQQELKDWIRDRYVQVAELWYVHEVPRKLLLIDVKGEPTPIWEDDIGTMTGVKVIKDRMVDYPEVVQYITNGRDILEETPWAGTRIPIGSCFGKELWVDEGGGAKRMLLSMIRLARDPQMLLAFLASQECEEAGMTPKAPFVGAVGQFETDAEAWATLNKIPRAYIQYDMVVDGVNSPLPAPSRPQFAPNFQEYEVAKDSARRSIQASMGITPLPTAAQRQSEKSGVALEKIQDMESIGTFHFTDSYDGMLENLGFQINELIKPIYDTTRDVPVTKADGTHDTLRLNDEAYEVQSNDKEMLDTDEGEYGVTISTGPNYKSQREQAESFVDTLLANLGSLPIPPQVSQQILSLAIKLKDIGPIGDEIAKMLMPPDNSQIPPQAQAAIAQAQGVIQQLQAELAKLTMERDAKVVDHQAKIKIEQLRQTTEIALKKLDIEARLAIAEVQTKAQQLADRERLTTDVWQATHDAAHELGMQEHQQAHEKDLADQQALVAQQQQQTQIAADQDAAAQEPQ